MRIDLLRRLLDCNVRARPPERPEGQTQRASRRSRNPSGTGAGALHVGTGVTLRGAHSGRDLYPADVDLLLLPNDAGVARWALVRAAIDRRLIATIGADRVVRAAATAERTDTW